MLERYLLVSSNRDISEIFPRRVVLNLGTRFRARNFDNLIGENGRPSSVVPVSR